MAANGAQDVFTPDNVLQAMLAMRGQDREKKVFAMEYLDKFQKSVRRPRGHAGLLCCARGC